MLTVYRQNANVPLSTDFVIPFPAAYLADILKPGVTVRVWTKQEVNYDLANARLLHVYRTFYPYCVHGQDANDWSNV